MQPVRSWGLWRSNKEDPGASSSLKCVGQWRSGIRHRVLRRQTKIGRNKRSRHARKRRDRIRRPCALPRLDPGYSIDCSSLPGLKRTAFPGGMLTSAPVRGFRPMPVLRGRTVKTPKPRSSMRSPRARAFFMLSKTVSTAISALVLVTPVLPTTSLIRSSLITSGSQCRARREKPPKPGP